MRLYLYIVYFHMIQYVYPKCDLTESSVDSNVNCYGPTLSGKMSGEFEHTLSNFSIDISSNSQESSLLGVCLF